MELGKKVKSGDILIKDIKHIANSRFRDVDDVADLISDIKINGQMEPIGIRIEDNALIYGNRRVAAFEKMGIEKIRCDFYEGVNDTQLMAMNISENHKRKSLTPVEYGRAIWMMQKNDEKLTLGEIAVMLSMQPSRVSRLIKIYNVVCGTPFETSIVQGNQIQGIPEQFISMCYSKLPRTRINGKLSKIDWKFLLEAARNREITCPELAPLRKICFAKPNIQMDLAIKLLKECRVVYIYLPFNENILQEEMAKNKITSEGEFIRYLIKQYNQKLLF